MTVIIVAIAVLVVLAAIALFAVSRRRDTADATGVLSRETVRRDRGRVDLSTPESETVGQPLRGRAYERSVALERIGAGEIEPVRSAPPAVYVPPDPETIGVTRRQFLNRSIVGFMTFGLSGFGAAVVAFLWPSASGGFGSKINVGNVEDVKVSIQDADGFLYVPEGRMWVTEYPIDKLPEAEAVYPALGAGRHGGRPDRPVADLPPPGLPGAPVPDLPVVRMPLPRLEVQPGG